MNFVKYSQGRGDSQVDVEGGNRMTASDSNRGFRQRLLDHSGVSDRRLSMLATGSTDTVRNIRRGSSPLLASVEVLSRVLGFRLEMVPLDELGQPPEEAPLSRSALNGPGDSGRKSAK